MKVNLGGTALLYSSSCIGKHIVRVFLLLFAFVGLFDSARSQSTGIVTGLSPAGDGSFKDGVLVLVEGTNTVNVFGDGLTLSTTVGFTYESGDCVDSVHTENLSSVGQDGLTGTMLIQDIEPGSLYLCVNNTFVATAANGYALIVEEEETPIAPLWAACLLIFGLLCLSGLFSGLNLGLMALDTTGLQIIMKVGEPQQKKYAETIYPIRKHGNLLLCTLLLGNVLVNNTLTIILESVIGGGVMAVILSTAGIVVFGEIIPQSICTRHGLFVGAKTIYITKLFVMLMFVIAYPISKILDWVLGRELGVMYSRRELKELVRLTGSQVNLNQDEMAMIGGVLDFTTKTVGQIMTPMQDVFMIEIHARLDFKTLKLIVESGHSRVPVYENDSYGIKKIVGILFVKDLTFVDPDDELPLSTVIKFYDRTFQYVFDDTKLDEMLSTFKSGHCHLAVVRKVNDEGEGDPFYENVGVISLEDVLEEIIQSEIVDETDRITDNITRNPVPRGDGNPLRLGHKDHASATNLSGGKVQGQTFDDLSGRGSDQQHVSSQLKLAILSFLTTSFDLFGESTMTRAIAQRVIDNAMYRKFNRLDGLADTARREGGPEAHDSQTIERARRGVLYESGKKTTVFTVILEGRVRVITNTDGLTFDAGPFSTLGIQALSQGEYVPDFRAITDLSDGLLMQITTEDYKRAINASKLQRTTSQLLRSPQPQMRTNSGMTPDKVASIGADTASEVHSQSKGSLCKESAIMRCDEDEKIEMVDLNESSAIDAESLGDGTRMSIESDLNSVLRVNELRQGGSGVSSDGDSTANLTDAVAINVCNVAKTTDDKLI